MEGNNQNDQSLSFEYYNGELAKRDEKIKSLESQINEMRILFKANFTKSGQTSNTQESDEERRNKIGQKIKEAFK